MTANGSFTFATQLPGGAAYAVTVKTNPSGQTCTVASGSGTIASANVTNVAVTCTTSGGGGVPGETVIASDSFNRADGSLGPNWTATSDGAMAIASQQVVGDGGAEHRGDPDGGVLPERSVLPGAGEPDAADRRAVDRPDGADAGQRAERVPGHLLLELRQPGADAVLAQGRELDCSWAPYNSGALPAGTQLQVTAVGSTISFLENGVAKITVTDTNLTGGAPGIMAYGNPDADTWSGGSVGSGGRRRIRWAGRCPGCPGRWCCRTTAVTR